MVKTTVLHLPVFICYNVCFPCGITDELVSSGIIISLIEGNVCCVMHHIISVGVSFRWWWWDTLFDSLLFIASFDRTLVPIGSFFCQFLLDKLLD